MCEEPDPFAGIFSGLKLFDHEFESTTNVWVGGVDEVQEIGLRALATADILHYDWLADPTYNGTRNHC